MSSAFSFYYLRHSLVVALGIFLFYILVSRHTRFLEYFQNTESLSTSGELIFTEAQLSKYDGRDDESLYLVILGHVYDVTKGVKHYGEGQAYHMFIGHDATRSFVTGEFDKYSEELGDVSRLTEAELKQLLTWKDFYTKTYPYRGKVIGRYFDHQGEQTAYYRHILARVANAEEIKDTGTQYPSCNVEWTRKMGTRVWCTNRSGDGQERQWVGFPRKIISDKNGGDNDRNNVQFCACIPENEFDAQYVAFPGCEEAAVSCVVPDQN